MPALALLSEKDVRDPRDPSSPTAMEELLPEPPWLDEILEDFRSLLELRPGWDSYGAAALRPDAVQAAFELLLYLSEPSLPAPEVVPLHSGGVQLEWHRPPIDLEIEVHSAFRFAVFYENEQTGEVREEELMSDLSLIRPWINQLSS